MWPWQGRRQEVEEAVIAEHEAEERQEGAKKVIAQARQAFRDLRLEYNKNSWNELFGEALRGRRGAP